MVTVTFSFIFRTGLVNLDKIIANINIILCIAAGSLIGAYIGVNFATEISEHILMRVVVVFLFILSFVLIAHNFIVDLQALQIPILLQIIIGFMAGILIGIFSSMLGVAGGELIIPTIVLVFSADIKLAGSLSLAISIPTIIMGLTKYQRQGRFDEIKTYRTFIIWTAAGSIVGAFIGSYSLKFVASSFLYILLGIILFISAFRLLNHEKPHKTPVISQN